jgi:predicted  nucleic acid-binding Zn-ribbon protein
VGSSIRGSQRSQKAVPIDIDALKSERDRLKSQLREVETRQRSLEAELKALRQSEIRSKREIEALSTLIELNEPRNEPVENANP